MMIVQYLYLLTESNTNCVESNSPDQVLFQPRSFYTLFFDITTIASLSVVLEFGVHTPSQSKDFKKFAISLITKKIPNKRSIRDCATIRITTNFDATAKLTTSWNVAATISWNRPSIAITSCTENWTRSITLTPSLFFVFLILLYILPYFELGRLVNTFFFNLKWVFYHY